jgi:hypothetical protein
MKKKKAMTRKEVENYLNDYGCIGYHPDRSQWFSWDMLVDAVYKLVKENK